MKKTFCFLLAVILLMQASGCAPESSPKRIVTAGVTYSQSADEELTPAADYLQKMENDLISGNAAIFISCPQTRESGSYQVRVDSEMISKIVDLLTNSPYEENVQRPRRGAKKETNSVDVPASNSNASKSKQDKKKEDASSDESSSGYSTWRAMQEKESSSSVSESQQDLLADQGNTAEYALRLPATPTPSPSPTPLPTQAPEPTPIPAPDPAEETETVPSPMPEITPTPTPTPEPAPTPEATPEPSPNPTPSIEAPQEEEGERDSEMVAEPDLLTESENDFQMESLNEKDYIDIIARSEDFYSKIRLTLLDGDMYEQYPDKTFMELETDDGVTTNFLYERNVYDEVYALIRANLYGVPVTFIGQNVVLRSTYDLEQTVTRFTFTSKEFLQFGQQLIWRFQLRNRQGTEFSIIEAFDALTGESLYSYKLVEPILRMERSEEENGYDYRIVSPIRTIYKNSANPQLEKDVPLPSNAALFAAANNVNGLYNFTGDRLLYAAQDGIYLSSKSGVAPRLVLDNAALALVMQSASPELSSGYNAASYLFNDARIVGNGNQMTAEIVCPQAKQPLMGFAYTDLGTGQIDYYTGLFTGTDAKITYLSNDMIAAQDSVGVTYVDLRSGEKTQILFPKTENTRYFSKDYQTFLRAEQAYDETLKCSPLEAYRCDLETLFSTSDLLLSTRGDTFHLIDITESFAIGYLKDPEGLRYTVLRYNEIPAFTAPAAVQQNPSDNRSENAAEDEMLPPDPSASSSSGTGLSDKPIDEESEVPPPDPNEYAASSNIGI